MSYPKRLDASKLTGMLYIQIRDAGPRGLRTRSLVATHPDRASDVGKTLYRLKRAGYIKQLEWGGPYSVTDDCREPYLVAPAAYAAPPAAPPAADVPKDLAGRALRVIEVVDSVCSDTLANLLAAPSHDVVLALSEARFDGKLQRVIEPRGQSRVVRYSVMAGAA